MAVAACVVVGVIVVVSVVMRVAVKVAVIVGVVADHRARCVSKMAHQPRVPRRAVPIPQRSPAVL
jgi:hypothetical protein